MERVTETLLNKGANEAAERGEDILKLRLECIVQFVYYLTLGVIFLNNRIGHHCIPMFIAAVIQFVIFFRSYKSTRNIGQIVFILCMCIFSILPTASLGVDLGFQYFMYVALMLILLETSVSYSNKIVWCFASILVSVILHAVNYIYGLAYLSTSGADLAARVRVMNEVAVALNVIIIGLSFAKHEVEAQRALYLANQKLRLAADTDALTKLPNRRAILEVLGEIDLDNDETISIAMGDIDHFKNVNDTYGHDAGDEVLKKVASAIMEFMDDKGYCARWGGEEFLLVFAGLNGDDAYMALDTFRRRLGEITTTYGDAQIKVTMTFGLEEHGFYQSTAQTIKDADSKLYTGKETGRNKVVY